MLQPIKVQTGQGKVESAIMHVVDMEASNADKRFNAMVRATPLHTFMFNFQGKLLVANDAAVEACRHSTAGLRLPEGSNITLNSLFDLGSYPGRLCAPAHAQFLLRSMMAVQAGALILFLASLSDLVQTCKHANLQTNDVWFIAAVHNPQAVNMPEDQKCKYANLQTSFIATAHKSQATKVPEGHI